jgi:hypothetical protein
LFVNYRLIIYASIIAGMPPPDAFWDFSTVAGFPNRYVITCLFTYYSCICSLDGYICNLSFFGGFECGYLLCRFHLTSSND